ncbi:MAG: AbrB/MazE/SpoVT family DNA-binding domain-containing protein [Candidatus Doudnabacteria bacterium]|nr:AbrB/MazE/SpoVT family DNA-binding domain-containing protein [Candidatus Doudnabacteria bacterium]
MSIVKVKNKYQVTLPAYVRKQAGIEIGDILEAKIENGKIMLSPQSTIDKRLAKALEEIEKGQTYGPFDTAEEMITALHREVKKLKRK